MYWVPYILKGSKNEKIRVSYKLNEINLRNKLDIITGNITTNNSSATRKYFNINKNISEVTPPCCCTPGGSGWSKTTPRLTQVNILGKHLIFRNIFGKILNISEYFGKTWNISKGKNTKEMLYFAQKL